jgi:hypothetical protein
MPAVDINWRQAGKEDQRAGGGLRALSLKNLFRYRSPPPAGLRAAPRRWRGVVRMLSAAARRRYSSVGDVLLLSAVACRWHRVRLLSSAVRRWYNSTVASFCSLPLLAGDTVVRRRLSVLCRSSPTAQQRGDVLPLSVVTHRRHRGATASVCSRSGGVRLLCRSAVQTR